MRSYHNNSNGYSGHQSHDAARRYRHALFVALFVVFGAAVVWRPVVPATSLKAAPQSPSSAKPTIRLRIPTFSGQRPAANETERRFPETYRSDDQNRPGQSSMVAGGIVIRPRQGTESFATQNYRDNAAVLPHSRPAQGTHRFISQTQMPPRTDAVDRSVSGSETLSGSFSLPEFVSPQDVLASETADTYSATVEDLVPPPAAQNPPATARPVAASEAGSDSTAIPEVASSDKPLSVYPPGKGVQRYEPPVTENSVADNVAIAGQQGAPTSAPALSIPDSEPPAFASQQHVITPEPQAVPSSDAPVLQQQDSGIGAIPPNNEAQHATVTPDGKLLLPPTTSESPETSTSNGYQSGPEVFDASVLTAPMPQMGELMIPGMSNETIHAPPSDSVVEPLLPQSTGSSEPPLQQGDVGHEVRADVATGFGHSISGVYPGTSGFRATVEMDAEHWMSPYTARANAAGSGVMASVVPTLTYLPPGYQPWWDAAVRQPTGMASTTLPVDISMLLQDAMLYSPQIMAIQTEPEVQRRVITQEAAKFDWTAFLETKYDDLNDPAGNNLATGDGRDRLLTKKLQASGGIRRKNLNGGEFSLTQKFGHENQNSRIFVPNNQGTSRLELAYRQPLWDGAGRVYNESETVLARIQANASEDEVVGALQEHLIEVTEAYWMLYRSRAEYFQRQKLLSSANAVLVRLKGRSEVDTIPRQVLRAHAAVARAQTRIQRTLARVKDAEAQLRLLVNSPGMLNGGPTELTPTEPPRMVTENSDLQSVLQTALVNRPDISEAIRKMRASSVRLGVSQTEILPRLDLLVETYVADLSGNSDVAQALRGQYTDNRPGYTIGLEFEVPIGNRAAIAKLEQRQWELKRSINVFKATVEKSLTDVEIANREVATAYSEMLSRYQSMQAAMNESRYLQDRFEVLPASEDSATLLLEDLLDSFERLADEETSFVQSQVDHAVAMVKLKKEIGILLQSRHDRPAVDAEQQAWVSQRIQEASDKTGRTNVAPTAFSRQLSGHAVPDTNRAGVVLPMPKTPTQWSQMGTAVGGYSIQ